MTVIRICAAAAAVLIARALPAAELEYQHLGLVEFIENQSVRLGIAPRVGRVVSFKHKKGDEWIVVEDKASPPGWFWNPWGGDRVWPTAQFLLPQIYGNTGFDPVIDGQPWEIVSRTESAIELRSGFSPQLGIRIYRKIELVPSGARLTYRIDKEQSSHIPVHIWAVTGIVRPDFVLLESDPKVKHPGNRPFRVWPEHQAKDPACKLVEGLRVLSILPSDKAKVGTFGSWTAAVRKKEAFLQAIRYDPAGLFLEASNLQFYTAPERGIYELETLSPTWNLAPGESKTWTVSWRLIALPNEAGGERKVAEFLEAEALKQPAKESK